MKLLALVFASAAAYAQSGQPIRVVGALLTRGCPTNYVDMSAETETDFLTTDPRLCVLYQIAGGAPGDEVRVEFRDPAGALERQPFNRGPGVWYTSQQILNQAGRKAGTWEIRFYDKQTLLRTVQFRIAPPPSSPIDLGGSTVLPIGTERIAYRYRFTAKGGVPPYRWTLLKDAPPGLSLDADGTLTGTPPRQGVFRLMPGRGLRRQCAAPKCRP